VTRSSVLPATAVRRLIRWYRRHHRDLPWRRSSDPYPIWVSEILLQQTRVETVRPYYERFLKRFPTVHALARAPIADVLKAWEGCGYYARARNLHRAAKEVASMGGNLPRSSEELARLPGIGAYTAAAVASIAFGEPVAVLDGNVKRVLARVLNEAGTISDSNTLGRLQCAADRVMKTAVEARLAPGDLNQALMELGATICKPRTADCESCPLAKDCRANSRRKDVTVLPRRAPRKQIPHYDIAAAIIRKRGRILITQRPLEGMLGGLWEFPGGKRERGESLEECLKREIREELGIEIEVGSPFHSVNHAYTHFRITLHTFECRQTAGRIRKLDVADYRWVRPAELSQYAFPKADRVILERLLAR